VPPAILGMMSMFAPDVVEPLFVTNGGRIILAIAAGLVLTAFVLMRQIVSSFEV
jgi:Flp pilus assembly protein TadB